MKIVGLNCQATYITDLNTKVSIKLNIKNEFRWTKYNYLNFINVLGTRASIHHFSKAI